ncbi:hypothetical protein [Pseudoclavibacter sp. CFCC 11306]|uniref:hypothetical protein n=1 Tax=Pseudoclavibacter sp. CFCC 11306 TaxID=1564493 RepID=UPI00130124F5|nr:hypothetical protein [Pseudoclavibacter sp. CFCC 11306]KAB1658166.1 hypothetical protein F8O09_00585 [Pseudoclavibacter sp. CFCC 11306]
MNALIPMSGGNNSYTSVSGQKIGGALAKQANQAQQELAIRSDLAVSTENAAAFHASVAMTNTVSLFRMAQAGVADIPEAAGLVAPILQGYAHGAVRRMQQY